MMIRVLVGCPTTEQKSYVLERYAKALKSIDYPAYDILIVDNSKTPEYAERLKSLGLPVVRSPWMENPYDQLIAARNILRERAIEGGYDYYLSLESDVLVPPDTLRKLLAHGKEYVTTVVYTRMKVGQEPFVVVRRELPDVPGRFRDITEEDILEGPLIVIDRAHLGCTLISTRLLKLVKFRHDTWQYDDYLLCDDLRKMGITLYCDTTIATEHYPDGSTHLRAREFRRTHAK